MRLAPGSVRRQLAVRHQQSIRRAYEYHGRDEIVLLNPRSRGRMKVGAVLIMCGLAVTALLYAAGMGGLVFTAGMAFWPVVPILIASAVLAAVGYGAPLLLKPGTDPLTRREIEALPVAVRTELWLALAPLMPTGIDVGEPRPYRIGLDRALASEHKACWRLVEAVRRDAATAVARHVIAFDPNLRIEGNRSLAGFEDILDGELAALVVGSCVTLREVESGAETQGQVTSIDVDRRLIEITVDWESLTVR
ncbi:hypothetical protein [Gordonia malaquae]|uniref:hypothetical protein n=1 Tax=Gordonia malaquae TaxID=410332 RepID=UPI00301A79A8